MLSLTALDKNNRVKFTTEKKFKMRLSRLSRVSILVVYATKTLSLISSSKSLVSTIVLNCLASFFFFHQTNKLVSNFHSLSCFHLIKKFLSPPLPGRQVKEQHTPRGEGYSLSVIHLRNCHVGFQARVQAPCFLKGSRTGLHCEPNHLKPAVCDEMRK